MKKIWNAKFRCGMQDSRVYGEDEKDAKKAAYSLFTYVNSMDYRTRSLDDVVVSVELAEDQTMRGIFVQPQVEYTRNDPEWKKLGLGTVNAGGMDFSSGRKAVSA